MSSLHLLDTNMVIYIQRGIPSVLQKLLVLGRQGVALPSLVVAELAYGVEKSTHQARNRERLEQLLMEFTVLPWAHSAMWHYAHHFHALRQRGQPIGTRFAAPAGLASQLLKHKRLEHLAKQSAIGPQAASV